MCLYVQLLWWDHHVVFGRRELMGLCFQLWGKQTLRSCHCRILWIVKLIHRTVFVYLELQIDCRKKCYRLSSVCQYSFWIDISFQGWKSIWCCIHFHCTILLCFWGLQCIMFCKCNFAAYRLFRYWVLFGLFCNFSWSSFILKCYFVVFASLGFRFGILNCETSYIRSHFKPSSSMLSCLALKEFMFLHNSLT